MQHLLAITGNPVLHSKSPLVFAATHPQRSSEFAYFRMSAQSADEAMQLFAELGLRGMNVTAPFKADVARLADRQAPEVQALGVANTVVRNDDGSTTCYNTDIFGVSGAFAAAGISLAGKRCVVLGAGGAGSAAAYALHNAGAIVTVANRTPAKAQQLADAVGCACAAFDALPTLVPQSDVVVSALLPNVDVLDEAWLSKSHIVFDAIYHNSIIREKAERAGCTFIDGAGWLIYQGLPAYRMFTGAEADRTEVKPKVLTQKFPRHIALVGFMGAGKSTVAPLLAKLMQMPVVELDSAIEKRCKTDIRNIIDRYGEKFFRAMEEVELQKVLASPTPTVISCGGGVVTNPALRDALKKNSIVVWLYLPPKECVQRIKDVASRPLLAHSEDPVRAAEELFEARRFAYAQTAWMLVGSANREPDEISKIIYDEVHSALHS